MEFPLHFRALCLLAAAGDNLITESFPDRLLHVKQIKACRDAFQPDTPETWYSCFLCARNSAATRDRQIKHIAH